MIRNLENLTNEIYLFNAEKVYSVWLHKQTDNAEKNMKAEHKVKVLKSVIL